MNHDTRTGVTGVCIGASAATGILGLLKLTGAPPIAISATGLALCIVSALVASALWATARRPR